MPVPSWLATDPVEPKLPPRVRPGWAPRPDKKVKIVGAWAAPEGGAGQAEEGPDPEVAALLARTGGWASDAYRATPPGPQSLTTAGTDAITPAESDASTQAPSPAAPVPAPARDVLPPSRTAPQTAPSASSRGQINSASPSALPPQGAPASSASRQPLQRGPQDFINTLSPYAMQVEQETGIPHQLLLAIPANETGWGSAVAGNNYFGIKGSNPKTGANTGQVGTWEEVNGQHVNIQDTFRAYDSPIESMRDFANLISTSSRYSNVRSYLAQHPNDWRGATQLLLSDGYATDSNWANQVISLGNQIDGTPAQSAISPSYGIKSVVDTGAQAIGMKYQWGGSGGRGQSALQANTDCSGFVSWAYEQATGVRLPAFTGDIYASTVAIGPNEAQPGDLVMFNMDQGPRMQHVGIYAGGNMMLHDSSINPNGGVDLTPLWQGAEFRRVPNVDPSLIQRQSMGAPPQPPQPQQATGVASHPPTVPYAQQRPLTETARQVGTGTESKPQGSPLEQALRGMIEEVVAAHMGSGQDDGSDLTDEQVQQIVATPGMGYQDYLDALRTMSRQVADEPQAPPVPQPAAVTESGAQANTDIGRAQLTPPPDMQGDPNRKPIPRPSPLQPPQQGTPPVQVGPITLPGTASPDYVPPRRPISLPPSTPTPSPQTGETGSVPDPDLAAHLGGGPTQPTQPTQPTLPTQPEDPVTSTVRKLAPGLLDPHVQQTLHTATVVAQDIQNPANMYPGIQSAVDYVRSNGFDPSQALQKFNTVSPDSAMTRYKNAVVAGKQADLLTSVAAGAEVLDRFNTLRADLVAAAQPPEVRDSPEGQAAQQGIALVTDPLNLVGLPEMNTGRLLIDGVEVGTRAGERLVPRVVSGLAASGSPELRAAEAALGRPVEQGLSQRVLQQAALDLNGPSSSALLDASHALTTTAGRYEPLSGEQLRRTVVSAVAHDNPGMSPELVLKRTDAILGRAGAEHLTTDAIIAPSAALDTVHVSNELLRQMEYPMMAGLTQPQIDKLWYTDPTALGARVEEYVRKAMATQSAARQEARAAPAMAAHLATGAAGGFAGYESVYNRMDPHDPNRAWMPYVSGGVSAAAAFGLSFAVPMAWRRFDANYLSAARDLFSPVENLTDPAKAVVHRWSGIYQSASASAQRLEDRAVAAFGKSADWSALLPYIEEHGTLPMTYNNRPEAQAFLQDWQRITAWARKYNLVPDPLNLGASSRVKTYVPHAVKSDMNEAIRLGREATDVRQGRIASNPFDHYNTPRQFETLRDGMTSPAKIEYDFNAPRLFGNYYGAAIKAAANDRLIKDMLNEATKGGAALDLVKGFTGRWRKMMLNNVAASDVVRLGPGMSAKDLTNARNLGDLIPQFRGQDVYVSQGMASVLGKLFQDPSFFDKHAALGAALDFNAQFKHNILGGSAFHLVNEMRQFAATQGRQTPKLLWTMFRDVSTAGGARKYFDGNAPGMTRAIRRGLQLNMAADTPSRAWGWQTAQAFGNALLGGIAGYQTGTSDQERLQHAGIGAAAGLATALPIFGGKLGKGPIGLGPESRSLVQVFSDALWQRYIPFMKYTTYETWRASNPRFAERDVAEFVNEVYGGQNLMAIGRSRTFQDALKIALLAPDWQEGWARQVGNAAFNWTGPLGQMNRTYWRNALLQSAFALEAMNRVFGGKWSWENDPSAWGLVNMSRLYDWAGWDHRDPTTGQTYTPYMDILGPYRAMLEPLRETARAATVATANALGYTPDQVPFHREIYGDFGDILKPDPGRAWGNFASSRIGFLPVTAGEFLSNKDWLGRPIDQPDDSGMQVAFNRLAQVAKHVIPTGEQSLVAGAQRGDPGQIGIFSAVTGMRTSHVSPTSAYFGMQDQYAHDLKVSQDQLQDRLNKAREDNQTIDSNIELLQAGTGAYTDDQGNAHDISKMTAAERDKQIMALGQGRVSQHKLLADFITERDQQGKGLSDEEKAQFAQQLQWLDRQTIVGSTDAPADLTGRPDIDPAELMRMAWNRDPTEIDRIQGKQQPIDWTNPVGGALSTLGTAVSGALLQPPPGKNATQELATLRARWTQETAAQWDIDPGVMEDLVKAHLYGLPDGKLPPLPGVKSSDLDSMAKDYAGRGRDPSGQPLPGAMGALAKQDYLFETAAQLGVSEQDLATRIRLRTLPMADQTPASQGRSNALDILSQGKAVPFVNPDGSPMGDPKQWQEWDNALTASKDRAHYRTTTSGGVYIQGFGNYSKDDLNQINKAKLEANANRFRQVLQSPNKDDYERWFGAGSGMTDEQWTKYQAGTLDGMWSDAPSPAEAQRRNGILRISQALTKPEQINWSAANNPKKITYDFTGANGYQYRNATLDQYLRYIRSVQSPAWKYVGQDLDAEPAP